MSGLHRWKTNRIGIVFVTQVMCLALVFDHPSWASQASEVLSKIEQLAALGGKKDRVLGEAIVDGIEKSPAEISETIIIKLDSTDLTEQQVGIYVWALGLTKDQAAVNTLIRTYKHSKTDFVSVNCLHALATIGGKQAGNFLVSVFDAESDRDKRSGILNLLGQMQFEPALPKMEEVLQLDPKEFYWKSVFVFGKMGEKSVPFLLRRLDHKERNVRVNVVNLLGRWLVPPEASEPLENRFWEESDAEVRQMILASLERTIDDPSRLKTVFDRVLAREQDRALVKFAQETIASMDQMKSAAASFAGKKRPSPEAFQSEYDQLFKTAGKKGSYDIIAVASTVDDELKLKALRERILQRDSDESFYDYERVNSILILNRMIRKIADSKQAVQP